MRFLGGYLAATGSTYVSRTQIARGGRDSGRSFPRGCCPVLATRAWRFVALSLWSSMVSRGGGDMRIVTNLPDRDRYRAKIVVIATVLGRNHRGLGLIATKSRESGGYRDKAKKLLRDGKETPIEWELGAELIIGKRQWPGATKIQA